ncbi:hypothetical protein D9613_009684 [Agrocybe pediades]|uniref:ATP-grasp domain-containing protein n=1 Tax=Agrocybe pediades TaxID=84607 RepID=A0A8H4VPW9_9AGAR|nr:hypothetical protein D9613_009684 [Agrocybe pediades]
MCTKRNLPISLPSLGVLIQSFLPPSPRVWKNRTVQVFHAITYSKTCYGPGISSLHVLKGLVLATQADDISNHVAKHLHAYENKNIRKLDPSLPITKTLNDKVIETLYDTSADGSNNNEHKRWTDPPPTKPAAHARQDEEIFQTAKLIKYVICLFDHVVYWETMLNPFDVSFSSQSSTTRMARSMCKHTFDGLKRGPDGRFSDDDLARILQHATTNPASAFRGHRTPPALRLVETMGMEQARAGGLCTDERVQKVFGLEPGLQAESTMPVETGSQFACGYTITRAVLGDAISPIRGNRFYTSDFTPANLTTWGYYDCQQEMHNGAMGGEIPKLLMRHFPRHYPELGVLSLPLLHARATKQGIQDEYTPDFKEFIDKGGLPPVDANLIKALADGALHSGAIDDRQGLAFGILARLDPSLPIAKTLNDKVIETLYDTNPHPIASLVGDDYQFRKADGSNNNVEMPDVGKAGMPYARSVQGKSGLPRSSLPDPGLVFDSLLKRDGPEEHAGGMSSLIFAYAAIVTHSLFRTNPNKDKVHLNMTSTYLDLSPLNGENQEKQDKVRDKEGGRGRGLLYPDVFSEERPRFLVPATSALLYIAEKILKIYEHKRWTDPPPTKPAARARQDEEIFQTAKLINCGHFMSSILGDYVAGFLGSSEGLNWNMNPFDIINNKDTKVDRGRGNHVSVEFSVLYRFKFVKAFSILARLDASLLVAKTLNDKTPTLIPFPAPTSRKSSFSALVVCPSAKLENSITLALKEEGIYTIMVNPNIATIATSKGLADKVYFLPVTAEFVRKIIKYEKLDGIYITFGGQTALSFGIALKDEFEGLGVKVLGTPIQTIITTEDRQLIASAMEEIGEKCAESCTATTPDEAVAAAKSIGFPVIIRAAYALGGFGSGFAKNEAQLRALCSKTFATSPQVLVERSMKGWKEIEYEVVR